MSKDLDAVINEFDLPGDLPLASDPVLAALRKEIKEYATLYAEHARLQAEADRLKKEWLHKVIMVIPELMLQIQSDDLTHAGLRVRIETVVRGTLPKEERRRRAAIRWLEENGAAGIIKVLLTLDFPRSQYEEALKVRNQLLDEGQDPALETSVHPQTLLAFARERLREGENIDLGILGLDVLKMAKIEAVGERDK